MNKLYSWCARNINKISFVAGIGLVALGQNEIGWLLIKGFPV